ncbi:MAG: Cob(I)alamin adenolsyltransferase/cobinamide ATP-dependent adenolsyltransferase [Promethearchaeota archaeon]|nr:MAG: Cob(I)alamin adenolsyltransferase/cobinamide ATP-dependent adenolsyltransferase [Candidatus Lokiarchaeota archaeon]
MNLLADSKNSLKIGLIHYYYGKGKGKTTSIIGALLRALGHELKPILIQFLKHHKPTSEKNTGYFMGEIHFLKNYLPVKQFGRGEFINPKNGIKEEDIKLAQKGFNFCKTAINDGKYDLVAMDEIVDATALGLLNLEDLIKLLRDKPKNVEVLISGYKNFQELIDIADYVTHFGMIKHPYNKEIEARSGIEY